jgi:OmpA-OmpF porin, OOP family
MRRACRRTVLVGRVPVGQSFNVFGKLGTTYSRTTNVVGAGSTETGGDESGWGPSVALGAGFDFNNNVGVVLQWDRQRMKFAGQGTRDVDSASVGLLYRF